MTHVRARCDRCGNIELTIADLTVHIWTIDGDGEYRFTCPTCRLHHVEPAERRTLDLLIACNCRTENWPESAPEIADDRLSPDPAPTVQAAATDRPAHPPRARPRADKGRHRRKRARTDRR